MDQGTMVRAGTGDSGTIRAAGSLAGTMIQHEDTGTMLGTLVINSDDEDVGTMKSKNLQMHVTWYRSRPEWPFHVRVHITFLSFECCHVQQHAYQELRRK